MSQTPEALRSELKSLGCSDHNCVVSKPLGMGTNGGCHCLPRELPLADKIRIRRAFTIYRLLLDKEPQ